MVLRATRACLSVPERMHYLNGTIEEARAALDMCQKTFGPGAKAGGARP